MRLATAIAGVVVWVLVAVAGVALGGQPADDPMLKGLQERGLKTLMDLYVKQKTVAPVGPVGPPVSADALAKAKFYQEHALAAKNAGERDDAFKQAKAFYEQAIADSEKTAAAISQDKIVERSQARLALLRMREALGNMIFLQWLQNELDLLEVTDRRFGDRNAAMALLKDATEQYKACLEDTTAWRAALDRMEVKQRSQLVNTGIERQVLQVQREVRYSIAWTTYYYAWVLPKDYKPAAKELTRADMLNDAITKFQEFTRLPDRAAQKWYSQMVIARAYRELGDYDKALQAFALADNASAPVAVRVRISYERALTYLRKGDRKKARDTVDEALAFWKGKDDGTPQKRPVMTTQLFAVALPLLKAESLMLDGKEYNDPAATDEGSRIFGEFARRPNPWPVIVPSIIRDILGKEEEGGKVPEDPTLLWMEATEAFRNADKVKDNKAAAAPHYKKAAAYYAAYAAKLGPTDKDYDDAMNRAGYAYLQLDQRGQALGVLQKLAETSSKAALAAESARIVVSIRGEIYQSAQSEANRAAYEQQLKWFLAKWPNVDTDQWYYLGNVLLVARKYAEASLAFAKVPEKSDHYPDARYWTTMAGYEQFRAKTLSSPDRAIVLTGARQASKNLMAYTDYAMSLLGREGMTEERATALRAQGLASTMTAAETYLLNEVMLPQDALAVIGVLKQRFGSMLQGDALGHVLLMEIISYQLLNQLDKAAGVLDDYLKVAKPDQVGPVLDGLFKAMIANVRDLIARSQKDQAAAKVEEARKMGDRLRDWLSRSSVADKAKQIEAMHYDLGELLLAVGKCAEALELYRDIGGPSPEDEKTTGGVIKEDCLYGQARAHEGLADVETDATRSRPHYEKAAAQWSRLVQITPPADRTKKGVASAEAEAAADALRQARWERIYHFYYCRYKLGYAKEVAEGLSTREALMRPEPLGGYKDQALQARFRELQDNAAADAGLAGTQPTPPAAPAEAGVAPPAAPAPAAPAAPAPAAAVPAAPADPGAAAPPAASPAAAAPSASPAPAPASAVPSVAAPPPAAAKVDG